MTYDGPRIPPLPPEQWPEEMGQAIAALRPPDARHPFPSRRGDRPKGLNALGTLARYPALTRAYHTLNGHVLFATTLTSATASSPSTTSSISWALMFSPPRMMMSDTRSVIVR